MTRPRLCLALLAGSTITLFAWLPGGIAPSALAKPVAIPTLSQTFTSTGAEQTFIVPKDITSVSVTAVGAAGTDTGSGIGGHGAKVTGTLSGLSANQTLYIEVGNTTGFGGGGAGDISFSQAHSNGGGASDVRTISRNATSGNTLDSRLIVAGGGGGAGDNNDGAPSAASGGNAGGGNPPADTNAADGADGAVGVTRSDAGGSGGGGGATTLAGGTGGACATSCYFHNTAGAPGTKGAGGNGGTGLLTAGGGGGLYGGGGSGGTSAGTDFYGNTGGGGGGSSLVPVNGSVSTDTTDPAEAIISYLDRNPVVTVSVAPPAHGTGGYFNLADVNAGTAMATVTANTGTTTDANITGLTCTNGVGGSTIPFLSAPTLGSSTSASATMRFAPSGTYAIVCTASDADGWSGAQQGSQNTGTVKVDADPPTIGQSATANGATYTAATWTNADVVVSTQCSDTGSGLATGSPPTDTTFSIEGSTGSVQTSCSDVAGNTASATFSPIKIDTTQPTITGGATTSPNANGWYKSGVTVTFTCTDPLNASNSTAGSGVATCTSSAVSPCACAATKSAGTLNVCASASRSIAGIGCCIVKQSQRSALTAIPSTTSTTLSAEGANQAVCGFVTDNAGNRNQAKVSGINIDLTAPTVQYSAHPALYTIGQTVSIACTPTDALSGVDTSTCKTISGPASSFGPGKHSFSATATDTAGNIGHGSTGFTVGATPASLCTLTGQLVHTTGVAKALCTVLHAITSATSPVAKAGIIKIYDTLVEQEIGKALTRAQAQTLEAFAATL